MTTTEITTTEATTHETQKSISDWANATFGPAGSLFRVATRANEEMAELLSALAKGEATKAAEELADVVIVCARISERLEIEPQYFPRGTDTSSKAVYSPELWGGLLNTNMADLISDIAESMGFPEAASLRKSSMVRAFGAAGNLADSLGIDIQAEIDRKMAINRARIWKLDGTGHGYHVKAAQP